MSRWLLAVAAGVVGLVVGAAVSLSLGSVAAPLEPDPSGTPTPGVSEDRDAPQLAPVPRIETGVLLAWTSGGLPEGFADAVAGVEGVTAVTEVLGGSTDLVAARDAAGARLDDLRAGWAIPLDTIAIDPDGYARFVPKADLPAVQSLAPGTALLGSTSAELRGMDEGGVLRLAPDVEVTVVGVVDDATVGAAELVLHVDDAAAVGIVTPRYVLLVHDRDRSGLENRVRAVSGPGVAVRIRGPGETPFLRHGDAVLPQSIVKQRFGEFAYQPPASGRAFTIDPDWVDENIVTAPVPLLGEVTCHRAAIRPLRAALDEVRGAGAAGAVDPEDFAGCWNPRLVSPEGGLSRHAWGIAVDLNQHGNPTGLGSAQDRRLVDALQRQGFGWGGTWLVPDPMHFELVGSPDPWAIKAPSD